MDSQQVKPVLEALLFVSEKPLMIEQVREVLGAEVEPPEIRRLLLELGQEFERDGRGLRIVEVAEGFQLVTDPALAAHVARLNRKVRTVRLTKPSLETLAIIAYRQPATRVEIEQIRGVDVGGVLETLLKLNMIRVTGRKEVVGRPILYGTTREFLEHFGLRNLDGLPSMEDLKMVTSIPAPPPEAAPAEPAAPFGLAVHPEPFDATQGRLVEGERPAQGERNE